ncbi:rod shape-determining protein MreD [Roseinatronobacter alkalisoli]|uniref:Rod shape-determining protein MreD n=1 Tax=Roseinatronobacter alkalisoli TaxID=3028235 RepID=A0ABT5T6X4_9RHOB|nr:rod shape-determining protein MreD [Roseinatronobacter sp. HJB301]MDD7970430.1 rod shape-determining protein MreD [Roseinatronobacter sp. HJB301]
MTEQFPTGKALYVPLFLALAAMVTFLRLLPMQDYSTLMPDPGAGILGLSWRDWPAPDFLLCLTLAWVVRRPDLLPAPVIAGYFLFEDMLLLRPPGLWALIVLLATEFLRARSQMLRGFGFWLEYALFIGLMLVMFLANRALLAIVIMPQAPLDLSFAQFLGTILVYPAVVALSHFVFKLRKPATGEVDVLGQKL